MNVQDLPEVLAEARTGRTPAEAMVWVQMHEDFLKEINASGNKVFLAATSIPLNSFHDGIIHLQVPSLQYLLTCSRVQGLDIVFYGDSITESLRGTQMGVEIEKFRGIPEVFQKHYGHLKAAAYSIAGALG